MQNKNIKMARRPIYTQRPASTKKKHDWRLWFWFILIILISGIIFHRLFVVQVLSHEELFTRAQSQHQYYEELTPKRGEIYLQNKGKTYPASVNEEMDTAIAVPKNVVDISGTAMTLATVLNLPVEEVRDKLTKNREDMYEVIKRKLTDNESLELQNKNLKGIELIPEYWRTFPASPLASQTVGFLGYNGEDKSGQYGVEEYFENSLRGKGGFLKAEKDTGGRWISVGLRTLQKAEDGDNLVLTIEQSVQYFVEKKLEEVAKKFQATSGNILIMEPKTGRIIAMANYPTYDNGNYGEVSDASFFQNKCIQEQYEPGSIFKPVTYSIAIDTGKMEPTTTYNDAGSVSMSGYTLHNFDGKGRGVIPMTKALDLSLNTGAIFAQQRAGKEKYYEYLKNFGLGEKLGIDLIGEANGDIKNLGQMKDLNYATAAFGQGVSVTPLQMVTAFSAVINGGHLMKPQIVEKVIKNNGEEIVILPKEIRRVISEATSAKMRAMLISVVKNGWSVKSAVPGYLIGGKTGTAQIPNPNGAGYGTEMIHSYITSAPMNDPRFTILVKLDKVKAVNFSSDSSSPVARQILEFLFDYYNISPTEDIADKEREQYKMYADRLKAFLGTDTNNSQETTSSSNIQRQINEESGDATTGAVTTNGNANSSNGNKDKKKKDNKNNSPAPGSVLNGGAGD
ncbi:MAG: penicillin-binding protein 2 [Candidatus Moraniibacteriota bacterium]